MHYRQMHALEQTASASELGGRDLDRAAAFIAAHWLPIAVAALLGAIAGWRGSAFLPKTYRAEILVSPVVEDASPVRSLAAQYGAIAGLAGIQLPRDDMTTAAAVATLKSHLFIEQFISDHQLLPILFEKLWDPSNHRWKTQKGRGPPTLQDGYALFVKKVLSISEDKQTGLVTIRVEWREPELTADWANGLVARLNEVARNRAIHNSELSVQFLTQELAQTRAIEIRDSIYALIQSAEDKRMLASTRPDFIFSVIDPAQAPEPNNYVKPVPLLLAALGFFSGALVAMMAVLLVPGLSRTVARGREK